MSRQDEFKAEPEQEPVAIRLSNGVIDVLGGALVPIGTLLYAAPPQRKPLTDEQCVSIFREAFLASSDPLVKDNMTVAFARAIERAHGIVS